jgi:hypothetical protein
MIDFVFISNCNPLTTDSEIRNELKYISNRKLLKLIKNELKLN